jgi:hypothetical protein
MERNTRRDLDVILDAAERWAQKLEDDLCDWSEVMSDEDIVSTRQALADLDMALGACNEHAALVLLGIDPAKGPSDD